MDPIVLRSFERLLAILIGGLAIYLGYRLFVLVPSQRDSEGRVQLPGDVSVFLTRVGPGVFFALFGSFLVGASFYFAVTIRPGSDAGSPPMAGGEIGTIETTGDSQPLYSGVGESPGRGRLVEDRGEVQYQIGFLNEARPVLHESLGEARHDQVDDQLSAIKLRLMERVWDDDWGDPTRFRAWVSRGVAPPDSVEFQRARLFYDHGNGGTP